MKTLSIVKTINPDYKISNYSTWMKYIRKQINKIRTGNKYIN